MAKHQKYQYKGPNSGITIVTRNASGEVTDSRDVMLWNGSTVELPDDNEHVKVMVHQGYLTALAEPKPVAKQATAVVEPIADATTSK